ncbi:MAG: CPBP family intramembrane glutamic endopeptidase [Phycisphaerales bacterium]
MPPIEIIDAGPPFPGRPGGPRRYGVWVAWAAILLVAGLSIFADRLVADSEQGEQLDDTVGLILFHLQGKYLIGASALMPMNSAQLYNQSEVMLNLGTLPQRQRFVVMAGEMAGPAEARRHLDVLDDLIASPPMGEPPPFEPNEVAVQRILHDLYPPGLEDLDVQEARAVAAAFEISPVDRAILVEGLGWFGKLAAAGRGGDDTGGRDALLVSAKTVAGVIVGVAILAMVGGVLGFAGLILLVVFIVGGRVRSGLGVSRAPHGVYAETFAVWLFLFIGSQQVLALVPDEALHMMLVIASFPASLVALGWPVLRGIPWRDVRQDVGLTLGARPLLEPLIGLGGYLVTLPMLAVGLMITLGLMAIQGATGGEPPTFSPAGGPAHPVITYMSGPDLGPKLMVLVLAAVCAPIVEETMFRGVLYRHLRGGTGKLGPGLSIAVSTLANTFLFAAIHPQGFVAIPALMGLACGMTLIREWRGTLVPSIVIHGTSNAIVMSTLWIALSV